MTGTSPFPTTLRLVRPDYAAKRASIRPPGRVPAGVRARNPDRGITEPRNQMISWLAAYMAAWVRLAAPVFIRMLRT
jgi:hypothetical protein